MQDTRAKLIISILSICIVLSVIAFGILVVFASRNYFLEASFSTIYNADEVDISILTYGKYYSDINNLDDWSYVQVNNNDTATIVFKDYTDTLTKSADFAAAPITDETGFVEYTYEITNLNTNISVQGSFSFANSPQNVSNVYITAYDSYNNQKRVTINYDSAIFVSDDISSWSTTRDTNYNNVSLSDGVLLFNFDIPAGGIRIFYIAIGLYDTRDDASCSGTFNFTFTKI